MRYTKTVSDGYIIQCGSFDLDESVRVSEEITETEHNEIMSVIRSCPNEDGKGYRLRADLTWEEYDLPPAVLSDDDELSTEEAMNILLGGAV